MSDILENEAVSIRNKIKHMKKTTRRSSEFVLDYYKTFLRTYPNGRINKEEFIDNIVSKLIIDEDGSESKGLATNKSEKLTLCERLFEICDQDETGRVDFVEVGKLNLINSSQFNKN